MKKVIVLFVLCFAGWQATHAQLDLKMDPVHTIFGTGDLSLEYIFDGRFGIEVEGGPKFGKTRFLGFDLFKKTGYRGFVAAKYYFSKRKLGDEFSVGLYLRRKYVEYGELESEDTFDDSFFWKRTTMGVLASFKHVNRVGFIMGMQVGFGGALNNVFGYTNEDVTYLEDPLGLLSGDITGRVFIGYRLWGNKQPAEEGKGKKKKRKKRRRR